VECERNDPVRAVTLNLNLAVRHGAVAASSPLKRPLSLYSIANELLDCFHGQTLCERLSPYKAGFVLRVMERRVPGHNLGHKFYRVVLVYVVAFCAHFTPPVIA
jgi:hypothetical protein